MPEAKTTAVNLPEALYAKMERAATAQARTVDEVTAEAVSRYLRLSRRERLRAYGDSQAKKLGLREDLSTKYVHDTRVLEHR